jgi:hypothetical protein
MKWIIQTKADFDCVLKYVIQNYVFFMIYVFYCIECTAYNGVLFLATTH